VVYSEIVQCWDCTTMWYKCIAVLVLVVLCDVVVIVRMCVSHVQLTP